MSETEDKPRKRTGRPPKAPEKGRRQNYTFRMSDQTRDDVITAAAQSGRSMSEELEWRIEESFRASAANEALESFSTKLIGGDPNTFSLVSRISAIINTIMVYAKDPKFGIEAKGWMDSEPTRAGVKVAVKALVEAMTGPIRKVSDFHRSYPLDEIHSKTKEGTLTDADLLVIHELHEFNVIDQMELIGETLASVASGKLPLEELRNIIPKRY